MEKESRSEAPGHFGERDRRLTMSLDTHYVASWDSTSHYYHPYRRILSKEDPIDPLPLAPSIVTLNAARTINFLST